jgi:hypothetical protein
MGNITVYAVWEAVIVPPPPAPKPSVVTPGSRVVPAALVTDPPVDIGPEPGPPVSDSPAAEVVSSQQTPTSASLPIILNTESVLTFNHSQAPEHTLAILKDEGMPVLSIGGREVPLAAGAGMPVWAPINQILVAIGIVMVISSFIGWIKRRKETGEQTNRRLNTAVILAIIGAVVFILTQDTRFLMVLFDLWTPVNAVIFAGVLINLRHATGGRKATVPE